MKETHKRKTKAKVKKRPTSAVGTKGEEGEAGTSNQPREDQKSK
jgi:hypothetical protein